MMWARSRGAVDIVPITGGYRAVIRDTGRSHTPYPGMGYPW